MAREFPDRVTAIVDLMSQMFLLAVMLFVMAIPLRSELDSAGKKKLIFAIKFEEDGEDGATIVGALSEMDTQQAELIFDLRLDNGMELRPLEGALRSIKMEVVDGQVRIEGDPAEHFEARKAVLLFREIRKGRLIGRRIRVITVVDDRCDLVAPMVVGSDPYYQRDDLRECLAGSG
ncbi:hypothetical protein JQ554_28065 [Bradyrhizobium diazoefficiens]|nr:hypothetical protein [Bradyrhizobium diazoefficiens]MBR0967095.1 hypothetical protein [Bradyrhizobium diazoefficiens]MBR0979089.1 hypothetical protein [Bradyrhizobium diazoefficiens]MBR1010148.1 hypothetical protein [Bradyrhizobium diazoefficiens]MBR1017376.1 hypothetical protein [Bradyrhizobium diazoefficiens]MBR1054846.1 hypothetical protein [Bradyrhizobium diazoefficiens]